MLTDDQTRDLLNGAAASIDVPARTIATPHRRAWPVLVAVAATVAVVAGGAGLALRPDPTSSRPPTDTAHTPTNDVDPYAGDPSFHLGPDQVPSVEGLPADAAVDQLEAAGFHVEIRAESSCSAGRALGTEPALGTLVGPGATVTVLRGDGSRRCLAGATPDFGLLDFLAGNGPAPQFADEVRLYDGADVARVISGAEAADPTSWPQRDVIRSLLDSVVYADGAFHPVSISAGHDPDDFSCGASEPRGLDGPGDALILTPWHQHMTPASPNGGCVDLGVHRDDDGAITAVQVDARSDDVRKPPFDFPPGVLGNSEDYARARLEAAGYHAEFVKITDCAPVGIVNRMAGMIDYYPGDTLTFGVTARTGACAPDDWAEIPPPADADSVAESFVRFARGGPAPAWADEVTLYVGDVTMGPLVTPGDRRSWGFCLTPEGTPTGRSCLSGNVLDLVADNPVTVTHGFADDACLFHSSDSLNDFKIPAATLLAPGDCGFAVEIWTDDAGRISGVDYLYPRP